MVIFAAVGGRASLYGAVYGTLLVNTGKSLFSENFRSSGSCDGRTVHRRGDVLPRRIGGHLESIRKKAAPLMRKIRTKPALPVEIPAP